MTLQQLGKYWQHPQFRDYTKQCAEYRKSALACPPQLTGETQFATSTATGLGRTPQSGVFVIIKFIPQKTLIMSFGGLSFYGLNALLYQGLQKMRNFRRTYTQYNNCHRQLLFQMTFFRVLRPRFFARSVFSRPPPNKNRKAHRV